MGGLIDFELEELALVGPILMHAALSDGDYAGSEMEAIRELLLGAGPFDRLPTELLRPLVSFDEVTFDLDVQLAQLDLSEPERRRELLALVGAVVAADGALETAERDYLAVLGEKLGIEPAQVVALTTDIR
ncbi:MAG: putative tellurite resistance protein B-like protein, partial [Myxococcota bacterium]